MSRRADLLHDVKIIIVGVIIGVLLCAGIAAWVKYLKPSPSSIAAQPAPELKGEVTTKLACKPQVVYRDAVAKKLGIEVKSGEHIVASAKLPADDRPHTVSALYSEETGITRLLDRRDPLPWLSFNRRAEAGLAYIIRDHHDGFTLRADGSLVLLRIKALSVGIVGQVDASGGWQAGARVGGSW